MKTLQSFRIGCLAVLVLVFASCSKEQATVQPTSRISPTPLGTPANHHPTDSLTGHEFVFTDLLWTTDSIGNVCILNRPDLFYLQYRPALVQITVDGIQWMTVYTCPFPTDPFYFDWLSYGVLKFYVFNYAGPLMDSTTSIKVRFL